MQCSCGGVMKIAEAVKGDRRLEYEDCQSCGRCCDWVLRARYGNGIIIMRGEDARIVFNQAQKKPCPTTKPT